MIHEVPRDFVQQGKWDCVASCIATLLGHTRQTVIQALAARGWRNDHHGCTAQLERDVIREFGFDLIPTGRRFISILGRELPDGVACQHSLNVPGYGHAMAWRNGKLLDPNLGKPGRKFWAPDADPMVAIKQLLVLAKKPLTTEERIDAAFEFKDAETYEQAQAAVRKWAA